MTDTEDSEEPGDDRADVASVEMGLGGDDVDPAMATQIVGLVPSRAWAKGQEYYSRGARQTVRRPTGLWVITKESTVVETAARELLTVIEPRLAAIRSAAEQMSARITIGIWWDPAARQGGFGVEGDVLRRLAVIGERINIYFPG